MRTVRLSLASSLVVAGLVTACSGSTPASISGSDDGKDDTKTGGTTSGGGGGSGTTDDETKSTSGDGGKKDDTSTCAASKSADACYDCCAPDESAFAAMDDAFHACACAPSGGCAAECGDDYCKGSGSEPSPACAACLDKADACAEKAVQACDADAKCKAADACIVASKCDDMQ